MKKLTLKKLEKIMIKLVKDNQEHAENIRVQKIDDKRFYVLCDIRYPDFIAKEDYKKWEESPEYTGWIEWKKGDNLKQDDEFNVKWVQFGIDQNESNRFFYSIDGLPSQDYFLDSTGYGVLNNEKAIEGLQKDMAEYGMMFEPYHSMTGVLDHAYQL
jgi:hypothetical protein|tara:strand:+ start:447 stop:917 length:471 start_codon:yes stop_codon:yes gene_type:complete